MKQYNAEAQYRNTLREILRTGTWKPNRTGIDSIALPYPAVIVANMKDGYPALTGRRAPFKSASGELCGFLRGVTSAADFRALGCKFWDQNANENAAWLANAFRQGEDDLGDVYGAQWRRWPAFKVTKDIISSHGEELTRNAAIERKLSADGWSVIAFDSTDEHKVWHKEMDLLGDCVKTIIKDPNNRRILFHAWNPAKLDEIALPACHLLYQFLPNPVSKELGLSVTIRSNDMPLGWPSNIMEAALLLELVAHLTGYKASYLTIISNDAHIYRNQLDMVDEYLARELFDFPELVIDHVPTFASFQDSLANQSHEPWYEESLAKMAVSWLDRVKPEHFRLVGYQYGDAISAPMAV
jgi:thymidylate synthase